MRRGTRLRVVAAEAAAVAQSEASARELATPVPSRSRASQTRALFEYQP